MKKTLKKRTDRGQKSIRVYSDACSSRCNTCGSVPAWDYNNVHDVVVK